MKPLEPLTIPLQGLALIEASAGTGKTYTISTLYLRLLLQRGLTVDRILVVTFTQAATEELRDRIRQRVVQALQLLRADLFAPDGKDPELVELLCSLADINAARDALTEALAHMDEAAIYTIHGFCQRMLRDNAFESGIPLDVDFITDESRLRDRAIEDFWRSRMAWADHQQARWVRAQWKTPAALMAELKDTVSLDDLRVIPSVDEAKVERTNKELTETFRRLKSLWHRQKGEVRQILETNEAIKRTSYNKNVVANALRAIEAVVESETVPAVFAKDFDRLTPTMLAEQGTKPGQTTPTHPVFELCGQLMALSSDYRASARALFLSSARSYVREALENRKRDEGLLYFDDLLRRLDRSLAAEGGERLALVIRSRFPVALIDEFQDTDPQQYRIFRCVYAGQSDCGLFLIGDPKQAIYAFRGADIFTYMHAREDSERAGQTYTLRVNWRSGSRLVTGVNTLFSSAQSPFIYEPHIQFHPVEPSEQADKTLLRLDGQEPVPLQFWMLKVSEDNRTKNPPGFIRKDAAQAEAAQKCAEYIARLLNQAETGQVQLGDRSLKPSDIALLVRTHREGDLVQAALASCGVNSVTLNQDSVFESEDAQELATVLEALAEINNEGRMRAALATGLLGFGAAELEMLSQDEVAWEALLARFQSYRNLCRSRGFMVGFQCMIDMERITSRLLRRPDGERRLTNLLQLMELLQLASRKHPGIDGLLRWFYDQRAGGERDEARQLRLESDEGLVRVVTMHKSKGLEYPLVFIPFPWSSFNPRNPPPPFFHDVLDKTGCLDLGSKDMARHRELESVEKLAEGLRLFYVAVTRAAKLCVICWGRVNGAQGSALAYLLHQDPDSSIPASCMGRLKEEQIRSDLDLLARKAPRCLSIVDPPCPTGERWRGPVIDRQKLSPMRFQGRIDAGWRLTSYSGLTRDSETEQPDYDAVASSAVATAPSVIDGAFKLPAGAQTGHFLHEVFEQLDFPKASGEVLDTTVHRLLDRYAQLGGSSGREAIRRFADWAPVVAELVCNVLDTPLNDEKTIRLRDVRVGDRLPEMEFNFPLAELNPAGLSNALASCSADPYSGHELAFEPVRGLMRGFIDLVFRHQGRYFIVDYKSNLLGNQLTSYDRGGMRNAIQEHRYDLQYLIYTVALNRFLSLRLPGYRYDQHFGGVFYLFLRGMRPAHGNRYGVWHDRPGRALIERLDNCFAGTNETA